MRQKGGLVLHQYRFVKWLDEVTKDDVALVGGKGANLGELTQNKIEVPPGFCLTADAYRYFLRAAGLERKIAAIIHGLEVEDSSRLQTESARIRELVVNSAVPEEISLEVRTAYEQLGQQISTTDPAVAVRSSATAEDLPEASFAGQQDTFLQVRGPAPVVEYVRRCWASLWTARAVYYREKQGFDHLEVALSVVVQKMINSGKSGVMFTANPVTNDPEQMMINASWGLGEAVVSGLVTPDEYLVDKNTLSIVDQNIAEKTVMIVDCPDGSGTRNVPVADQLGPDMIRAQCLTAAEIMQLVQYGRKIEDLYGCYQDIEWGYDQDTGRLYILQARPVTTFKGEGKPMDKEAAGKTKVLVRGLSASPGLGSGTVKKIKDVTEIARIEAGDVLVTVMTNPDMVPAMRKASAVVTDEGGRTCHAAIVSRELGIPCIVGAKVATAVLAEGSKVTVDATCGVVYAGEVIQEKQPGPRNQAGLMSAVINEELITQLTPVTATKIYMNLGQPSLIDKYRALPFDGIGLMRTEFIFSDLVGAHPMYLVKTGQGNVLVEKMAAGISTVAQVINPRPVVVRLSDFRTNEFRGLKGGEEVEPIENNPMIGWRGVARYISPEYEQGFRLECQAIRKVREEFGLTNVWVMLPFVRTIWELKRVKKIMASEGLVQGNNFKLWIMAEVPSVIFEAEEFAQEVDGFSIGSNDLTQLIMGADRDSGILNRMGYFDERNRAVKRAIVILIQAAHKYDKTVSICGQGPSQYPEFASFLVQQGVDSMSVNPDTVVYTKRIVASVERKIMLRNMRQEVSNA
ncbi:MAG: phosphoenolpyruvate synthase [bacterium]